MLRHQDEIVRAEVVATKRQGRVVLAFARFPTLSGWVRRNCLAVFANGDDGEYFDQIIDFDSMPVRLGDTEVFVCKLCEGQRREFLGQEALWADHLFEPFADWIRTKLRPAIGVEFRQMGGTTWAKLCSPDNVDPLPSVDGKVEFDGAVDLFHIYRPAKGG